ncbi:MAG: hypothetical protein JXX14_23450 [Deltaproteobacteria bacterium]|nr:hypothetical protein [Deltaproteobacteria bacterium]
MKQIFIFISIVGIVLLSIAGGVDPTIPDTLKSNGASDTHLESPHFPD